MPYVVTLEDSPEPAHEAAYSRLVRLIRSNKTLLDGLMYSGPLNLGERVKLSGIRSHRDIVSLRNAVKRDEKFRVYLLGKIGSHFGVEYAKALFRVFIE
jgi:hypothetical protein